jgi:hypothetical protein
MLSEDFLITLKHPLSWWGIRHMRTLYRSCARVLAYVPVIWSNEDWDYSYILRLLRYKIWRTRHHIAKHRIHVNWEKDVESMDSVIIILDRIIEDDYCKEDWDAFYDKWNPERSLRTEVDDEGNTQILPMGEEEGAEFKVIADKDHAATESDWKALWTMLERHLRDWWD